MPIEHLHERLTWIGTHFSAVATLIKHGGHLLLSDIHTRPVMDLERLGMTEVIGAEQIHGTLESAVRRAGELVGKA